MEFKNMNERASYNAAYFVAQGAHLMGAQIDPNEVAQDYVYHHREWAHNIATQQVATLMSAEEFIYNLLMQPV